MRALAVLVALLLAMPAVAQTALAPLPSPNVGENASVSDFLHAAQGALATGRTGEAENALEMAQTRMLDRSVPLFQTQNVSDNPTVVAIGQARQALAAGDRDGCLRQIAAALQSAQAQGL